MNTYLSCEFEHLLAYYSYSIMLTLQRASAGSGKTYTLTRRYIGLLISIKEQGSTVRRLRTMPELADSVQHILAVTFTNKATNEMKERIVSKLYQLAYPEPGGRLPDYMEDFMKEYAASAGEVSEACREALHQLLYEYSDFNISTIDAFFQNILRTFAYESELPDSYQVVIDFKYLARLAAYSLVEDVAHGSADVDVRYWISRLIDTSNSKGENNWNLFQRRESSSRSKGVFGMLCNIGESLDKPELEQEIKTIDEFLASGMTLRQSAQEINDLLENLAADLFARLVAAANDMKDKYKAHGELETLLPGKTTTLKFLDAVTDATASPLNDSFKFKIQASHVASGLKVAERKKLECLRPVYEALADAYAGWREFIDGEELGCWRIFEKELPSVALMETMRKRVNDFLTDNDAMKLADTNSMIRRIIADDDVPFIYERLGTRLNHFLVDEFQDTSLLQWENFLPLLRESESHGHDNLIIGDAKQSIYRFRSAEPTLITDIVPSAFPGLEERGFSVAENSNWRSRQKVVKFNNLLFRRLSARLGERIASLYSNTVQLPRSREEQEGYVEVNFYDRNFIAPDLEEDAVDDDTAPDATGGKVPPRIVERIGCLITSMLRRGYRQKEIAVLVNTRAAGKEVIAGLMDYNRTLGAEDAPLQFVSEDSLTLDSSGAVNSVVECFRLIQRSVEGYRPAPSVAKEQGRPSDVNWSEISNNFRFFTARHPDMPLPERLEKFFADGLSDTLIDDMIAGMQAITLPSLTEALAELFTTEEQRRLEAPFLAAFQDAVLDYCETNPTDIGSMLRWWDTSGHNISINSPEDTDAINVMTIHKSKGLEFECVILPDIDINLEPGSETLWVDVPDTLTYASLLPKRLPVRLNAEKAASTPWSTVFARERHDAQVDQINKAYVAMTRAVSEMYIFLQAPFTSESVQNVAAAADGRIVEPQLIEKKIVTSRMRHHLYEICRDADESIAMIAAQEDVAEVEISESEMLPGAGEITHGDDVWCFRYGTPLADVPAALCRSRATKGEVTEQREIECYYVNSDREILKFHPEHTPYVSDVADEDRIDPRSEGSLKHAVLELVEKESDLHRALERLRGRGIITRKVMRRYEAELSEALASVRETGWFDGSHKVLNERPMLRRGLKMKRPDRVMISPEGDAVVIDYKFGDDTNKSEHHRQVGEYIGWMRAMGCYRSVRGYLWYVKKGEVAEVTRSISPEESRRNAAASRLRSGEEQKG